MKEIFCKKYIILFFFTVLNFGTSILIALIIDESNKEWLIPIYMWIPAWIAIMLGGLSNINSIKYCKLSLKGIVLSLITASVYCFFPYTIYLLLQSNNMWMLYSFRYNDVLRLIFNCIATIPIVLGEEIGWRVFYKNQIDKFFKNDVVAKNIVGIIWGLWHFPLVFSNVYFEFKVNTVLLLFFVGNAILVNQLFFLVGKSDFINLILIHSFINTENELCKIIFGTKGNIKYYAGETGITTIVICILILYYIKYKNIK